MSEQLKTGFGASVPRKEDRRFITGQGRYTDDLKLPGQAYAYFVRSPYAHARILEIDLAAALEAPGVIGILTGEDYEASGLGPLINGWDTRSRDGTPAVMAHRAALTKSEVKFAGEAVAVHIELEPIPCESPCVEDPEVVAGADVRRYPRAPVVVDEYGGPV